MKEIDGDSRDCKTDTGDEDRTSSGAGVGVGGTISAEVRSIGDISLSGSNFSAGGVA